MIMNLSMTFPRYLGRVLGVATFGLLCLGGAALAEDVEALYEAAGAGDSATVAALLQNGVNVNSRTRSGSYALNAAAVENEIEIMKMLIDHEADLNVRNSQGDTPLICATKYAGGKLATVRLLVEAGTDLGIRDNSGKTALDYAKAKGQRDAIVVMESARD
jgi:ankyrin repeat protein